MTLEEKVKDIIVKVTKVKPEEVKNEAHLVRDLGVDSFATVELVAAFEAEFDIEIPPEDAERVDTVGKAVDYIRKKVEEKNN
ncbi:MAG TPA: acyl carrier protein [Candidatus Aerophobetes bacterium]|uniref:Acyl carrier protein n=1 Tax=Aerophobetes bacterium TaxID=2030807 RepID=A0A7V0QQV7_UNCAE|nr:acyl carrier protein [Candidatus Aerophobetes bacterium]